MIPNQDQLLGKHPSPSIHLQGCLMDLYTISNTLIFIQTLLQVFVLLKTLVEGRPVNLVHLLNQYSIDIV